MSKQLYGTIKGFDEANLSEIDVLIDGNDEVTENIPSTLTEVKLDARCVLDLEGTMLTVTGMIGNQELYKDTKQAKDDAAKAKADAEIALNSANSKNKITHSTSNPSGINHSKDDIWYKYDSGNNIVGQWRWDGSKWISQQIDSKAIASIDAGKITAGRIEAAIEIIGGKFQTNSQGNRIEIYGKKPSGGSGGVGTIDFYSKIGDITHKVANIESGSYQHEIGGDTYDHVTTLSTIPDATGTKSSISIAQTVNGSTGDVVDSDIVLNVSKPGVGTAGIEINPDGAFYHYGTDSYNIGFTKWSNDNGDYVKYSDGRLECEGTIEVSGANWKRSSSGLYHSPIITAYFAHEFIEPPRLFISSNDTQVDNRSAYCPFQNAYTNRGTFMLVGHDSTDVVVTVYYLARGRWK